MTKKKRLNERCPFEGECCRKICEYKFKEKQCGYYSANETDECYIDDQRVKYTENLDALLAELDDEPETMGIKMLPMAKELVKKLKAKKIHYSETYGGKYQSLGQTIYLKDWDGMTIPVKEDETRKLYYFLDESWGKFAFYVETPKKKPVKRPPEEIEREKHINAVWNELEDKISLYHKLRSDFVKELVVTSKNTTDMFRGAILACTLNVFSYIYGKTELARDVLEIEQGPDALQRSLCAAAKAPTSVFPQLIYAAFGDDDKNGYKGGWRGAYPFHKGNEKLDALYTWLCSVGYQMSDDEIALQNGTHDLFKHEEKEKETTNA